MKKVTFDSAPVWFIIKENEYHKKARESDWMRYAVDRFRFRERIKQIAKVLNPVLKNGSNRK